MKPQQRPSFEENVPKKKTFNFNPVGKEPFDVEEVLTSSDIKLEERMTANVIPGRFYFLNNTCVAHSLIFEYLFFQDKSD